MVARLLLLCYSKVGTPLYEEVSQRIVSRLDRSGAMKVLLVIQTSVALAAMITAGACMSVQAYSPPNTDLDLGNCYCPGGFSLEV